MESGNQTDGTDHSQIVLRAMTGDRSAFESIVEHYDRRLLYYVRRLVPDGHRATDIVQEVWLTVFQSISHVKSPYAFSAWLYRIAHRATVCELRAHHRHGVDVPLIDLADSNDDELIFRAEQAALVHEAMAELSLEHRETLLLRFLEAFSIQEIAEALERPQGTVKSQLHYAKQQLRQILERKTGTSK